LYRRKGGGEKNKRRNTTRERQNPKKRNRALFFLREGKKKKRIRLDLRKRVCQPSAVKRGGKGRFFFFQAEEGRVEVVSRGDKGDYGVQRMGEKLGLPQASHAGEKKRGAMQSVCWGKKVVGSKPRV